MASDSNNLGVSIRVPRGLQELVVVGAAATVLMLALALVAVVFQHLGEKPAYGLLVNHPTTSITLAGAIFSVVFASGRWLWRRHISYLERTAEMSQQKTATMFAQHFDVMSKDIIDIKRSSAETTENVKRINGNVTRNTQDIAQQQIRHAELRAYLEGQSGKPLGSLDADK